MVNELIKQARIAQAELEQLSQQEVRKIVLATAWAVLEPSRNRKYSQLAVESTGIGKVEDKMTKNKRKTLGLLSEVLNAKTFGILSENEELGLIEVARPIGVVGAITPSTNPIATPLNNIINSLICRNAIVLSPSPKGSPVLEVVLQAIEEELKNVSAPKNIIQKLPTPVNKEATEQLMKQVDLIVCTGSRNNVRNSYSSGVPALGVGVGNVVVIVDSSADLDLAADKIKRSKTFDYATSCSSENSLVIVEPVYSDMLGALKRQGGVLLDADEKAILEKLVWQEGKLNPKIIAQSAQRILDMAGISRPEPVDFLMVEETGVGTNYPFSGEKLSPIVTLYRADDFKVAKEITLSILDYDGKGHSVGIHTEKKEQARELGLSIPVGRIIVNQAHCFATGGSFENHLPFSLSMGCGSWGKNSFSDNLNYRHFYNKVRIAFPVAERQIDENKIFQEYLNFKN